MARPVSLVAAWTAALTLGLMTLGGIVHAAGASLACPDWPLCHGSMLPAMVGGVALEHSHRLLGALVAAHVVVLAIVAHRSPRADLLDRRLAWLAVALVAVQALLGGATVLVRLSPLLSTLHLGGAMALLAVLAFLAGRPHAPRPARPATQASLRATRLRGWTLAALGVLYAQMILGAVVRHTHAAMACGTDPWLCGGSPWPTGPLQQVHMAHRLVALGVTLLILIVMVQALRYGPPTAQRLGLAAGALVAIQVTLGITSVAGALPVAVVAAHLTVAALLWVTLLLLWVRTPAPGHHGRPSAV